MPRMTAFLPRTVSLGHWMIASGGDIPVTTSSIGAVSSKSFQARRNLPDRSCSGVQCAKAECGMSVSAGGKDAAAASMPQGGDDPLRDVSGAWSARLETAN